MADNKTPGAGAPKSISDQLLEEAGTSGVIKDFKKQEEPAPQDPPPGGEEKKPGEGAPNAEKKEVTEKPAAAADDDIPDDILMKALAKKGIQAKSIDELIPKEEITDEKKKELQEKKRGTVIEFAKAQGLFTQKQYDDYVKFDSQQKSDVVKAAFIAQVKKQNPEATDKEAEEYFDETFFTLEDEGSSKFKYGQAQIEQQFEAIKRSKFSNIIDAEQIYDGVQTNLQKATSYKSQVDSLFEKDFKNFAVKVGDQEINYPITTDHAELINAIKKDYLTPDMMNALMDQTGKVELSVLREEIEKDLFWKLKDKIILEVATAIADKAITESKKGRKGVIQADDPSTETETKKVVKGKSDELIDEAVKSGVI